ncbi:MAG: serine hydrolase [Patescibacteria group bacterium]
MDFFILTIASLLLVFGLNPAAISEKAKAGSYGLGSGSANHLIPAKRVTFPYRPKGVELFDPKELSAKEAIVMDEGTGRVLFQKDAYSKRPIASLTKLMTALLWFEVDGDLNKTVEIKSEDYRDGSIPYFIAGDKVTTKDLLYAGLVASSNSAMAALVRSSGYASGDFSRLMNSRAQELGMKDTFFAEPTGLDSRNVSTASDLYILARNAFGRTEISSATQLPSYSFKPINRDSYRQVKSTDWLLNSSVNGGDYKIIGGKTGYIQESDYNFVLKVYNKQKNKDLIIVILGSKEAGARFEEAKKLTEWAYKSYIWEI